MAAAPPVREVCEGSYSLRMDERGLSILKEGRPLAGVRFLLTDERGELAELFADDVTYREPISNPVVSDDAGLLGRIFVRPADYGLTVTDATGSVILTGRYDRELQEAEDRRRQAAGL